MQNRLARFDSGLSLHYCKITIQTVYLFELFVILVRPSIVSLLQCPGGEIGRRKGLKIPRPHGRAGSIPALGTKFMNYGVLVGSKTPVLSTLFNSLECCPHFNGDFLSLKMRGFPWEDTQ